MTDTWVRAYHDSWNHYYVNTSDLTNFRVARNYANTDWIIFGTPKAAPTTEIALLGVWDTEAEAGAALRNLLHAADISA